MRPDWYLARGWRVVAMRQGVDYRGSLVTRLHMTRESRDGIIRRTRAHGRGGGQWVRLAMYACGARARGGGAVCPNRVELREDLVDRAILRALTDALERQTLDRAIETALDKLRQQRATGLDRRMAIERELSLIVARQDRLASAIADGEAMRPLLVRMKAEETRKAALLEELATLDGAAGLGDLALTRTQRVLRPKRPTAGRPRAPTRRSEGRPRGLRPDAHARSRGHGARSRLSVCGHRIVRAAARGNYLTGWWLQRDTLGGGRIPGFEIRGLAATG